MIIHARYPRMSKTLISTAPPKIPTPTPTPTAKIPTILTLTVKVTE